MVVIGHLDPIAQMIALAFKVQDVAGHQLRIFREPQVTRPIPWVGVALQPAPNVTIDAFLRILSRPTVLRCLLQ